MIRNSLICKLINVQASMKENKEKKIKSCDEISKLIKAFPKDIAALDKRSVLAKVNSQGSDQISLAEVENCAPLREYVQGSKFWILVFIFLFHFLVFVEVSKYRL